MAAGCAGVSKTFLRQPEDIRKDVLFCLSEETNAKRRIMRKFSLLSKVKKIIIDITCKAVHSKINKKMMDLLNQTFCSCVYGVKAKKDTFYVLRKIRQRAAATAF